MFRTHSFRGRGRRSFARIPLDSCTHYQLSLRKDSSFIKETQKTVEEQTAMFNQLRDKFTTFLDKNEILKESGNDILVILDKELNSPNKLPYLIHHLQKLNAAIDNTDKIPDLILYAKNVEGSPDLLLKILGFILLLMGAMLILIGCLPVLTPFVIVTGVVTIGVGVTMFGTGCQRGLSKKIDTFANHLLEQQPRVVC